jgi:hypothetical protein
MTFLQEYAIEHFTKQVLRLKQALEQKESESGKTNSRGRYLLGVYLTIIDELSGPRGTSLHQDAMRASLCPECKKHLNQR